ncbi:MAG: HAD-IA family hydrolase [Bacillota bacterium]
MKYKSIIFDFDGTLADSSNVVNEILGKLTAKYHYTKFNPKELKHRGASSLLKKIQMLWFLAKANKEFKQMYGESISRIRLYDGILQMLQSLSGCSYHFVILSSNSVENIQAFLKMNAIEFSFSILTAKGLFGKHKIIKDYMAKQNCAVSDILYIGDEIRDIRACNKAGVDIAFVKWGMDSDEEIGGLHVKYIAETPSDLLVFLLGNR